MAGTFKSKMITPLRKPQRIQTTKFTRMARPTEEPSRIMMAMVIQPRPAIAPPEISMPEVMMINVWATARTPMMAPCFVRFIRLYFVRKLLVPNAATRNRTITTRPMVNSECFVSLLKVPGCFTFVVVDIAFSPLNLRWMPYAGHPLR